VIRKIVLKNFRRFEGATLEFSDGLNILVGDNESGKSTVLEAINLALTGRWHDRYLAGELPQHFITSNAARAYVSAIAAGENPEPPELLIELYLSEAPETVNMVGENNSLRENAPGIRLVAHLNPEFGDEYAAFVAKRSDVTSVPVEYYRVDWHDFAQRPLNSRTVRLTASLIDASRIRLQSGADYYLQRIINDSLSAKERAELARGYRFLQEQFATDPSIDEINRSLDARQDRITDKRLTLEIDTSRSQWEGALAPHLDKLPFQVSGGGEQNKLKILLALARRVEDAHVILIEEPENHLSFSSLNQLLEKIDAKCAQRQVIITTHSSFVVNKLGLEQLMLLCKDSAPRLTDLPADTQNYFKKLPGYDTLRLVLAKAVVLVEGPSDELVVQRAYLDRYSRRPIEDGIDVISVRGLSAKRFLDLAVRLKRRTIVLADNDGDFTQKVDKNFQDYGGYAFITICRSEKNKLPTLEPQLAAANSLETMNTVLGKHFASVADLVAHMSSNKTDCALKIHDAAQSIVMPEYIKDALDGLAK
jgi:ABC-type lipoprotein export system ATPase subunit